MPSSPLTLVTCLAVSIGAAGASAQTPPATAQPGPPPAVTWSVGAGYETFARRDVARTSRPVDASPVAWKGDGPSLLLRYDRRNPRRLHRFEIIGASAGDFVDDAVVRTTSRSQNDGATRVDGRYEYRWYPFRNLWIDGLDLGLGVQGIGAYASSTQHMDPSITIHGSEVRLGVGLAAAARFHRWRRLDLEVAWVNGGFVSRNHGQHSVDPLATYVISGGGWLTDLSAEAVVPVSTRVSILASYVHTGEGRYASHDTYSSSANRLLLGIRYAR
jgi:hypothetical protein